MPFVETTELVGSQMKQKFTYTAKRGTKFVWDEIFSKISITWNGNQLLDLKASRKVNPSPMLALFGLPIPSEFSVPVNNQELEVIFIPDDLMEWLAFVLTEFKENKDLNLILKLGSYKYNLNGIYNKEENNKPFEQTKRRGRREL